MKTQQNDALAKDWESVKILPACKWHLIPPGDYYWQKPEVFWTKADALKAQKKSLYKNWKLKKVIGY